jgi:hypothetical protein
VITLSVPKVASAGFSIEPVPSVEPRIRFSGNGDTEAIQPLDRFLKLVHQEMTEHGHGVISVDFADLYFMNSSCLKEFVSWIYGVNTGEPTYRIRLLMNPRLHWQTRSLATLQRLAPQVVEIQEVA